MQNCDTMNKIEQVNELHEQAMQLAEEAFLAQRAKNNLIAKDLYEQAYGLEKQAALMLITDYAIEPSRSVLFKGAASLALNAENYQEAERMIRFALLGNPPSPIEQELQSLLLETKGQTDKVTTMDKFQQLPENLQQEVADFIDFLVAKHQVGQISVTVSSLT